jgi:photosystem II stability/assembly factor-like uncharacterized protein
MATMLAAPLALVAAFGGCGDDHDDQGHPDGSAAIEHVHGLGVNPADGALFIATHSGLFRSPEGSTSAEPVGTSKQDTMGFTVAGPDRFLGSGHPGPGQGGPSSLGLIESTDAGQSWKEISLAGRADFHVLRFAHGRVYAYNGLTGTLMLSDDGGEKWEERKPPGQVIDLAVDPSDPDRMIVSTDRGLQLSADYGESWQALEGELGLLAWAENGSLYAIDANGIASVSEGPGERWRQQGSIGGQPAAFAANGEDELFAALGDGTVMASTDGGASWTNRVS